MKIRKFHVVVLIVLGFWSCQKADLSKIENLRNNQIAIIGHGGFGFTSPEVNIPSNSFEGITKAVEGYQADGVEVDVQVSADSILYLYHDSRLQTLTDCLGCLYQYEGAELEECKYVNGFNTQNFRTHRLVQLEEIIERFENRTTKPYIFLDIKTSLDCSQTFDYSDFEGAFIESLTTLFEKYNCKDWVIIESSNFSFLKKLQNRIPQLRLIYLTPIDEETIQVALENDFWGLSTNQNLASKETIRLAHESGLFVILGILKIRRDAIEMIEMSPDFIYTDNIPLLKSILD